MGEHAERFTALRPLLFTIAYEILGSATESDDVQQDSYLRWAHVDLGTVRDSKSYLATLVTRQALNALRVPAGGRITSGRGCLSRCYSPSRTCQPMWYWPNRCRRRCWWCWRPFAPTSAVFVLREVFCFDYEEIAAAVGKSIAATRQVAHRAREHVQARRPRFGPVDAEENARIAEKFMIPAAGGDIQGMLAMLAPDVTWTADGGGKASAARRPVVGADKVARAIAGTLRGGMQLPAARVEFAHCNFAPAVLFYTAGRLEGVFTVEIVDGLITNFYATRNPDKLAALAATREISRR